MSERKTRNQCLDYLGDFTTVQGHLRIAAYAYERLKRFKASATRINQDRASLEKAGCRNLGSVLADAALDAEKYCRISAAVGLESLNLLRDSGQLDRALVQAREAAAKAKDPASVIPDALEKAGALLAKEAPDVDFGFLKEAQEFFKRHKVEMRTEKDRTRIDFLLPDGKQSVFYIGETVPGMQGRVSISEFFKADESTLKRAGPVFATADCHHLNQYETAEAELIDYYGSFVASMKYMTELSYLYARKLSEIGLPKYEGKDPVSAAIGIAVTIAVALVVAGTVIEVGCVTGAWSGDVCDYGLWLILGGFAIGGIVCALCPAECVLVINGIVVVAA